MATATNGAFVAPPAQLAAGFEWDQTYDELIEQIAATNVIDADWPILRDMLKYKLEETISSYLALGPPWPLSPEEAFQARTRAYETLDLFNGPPFTIQRLCELSLHPRKHYTSLPKYLRALTRVMSVSSERSAFTEEDDPTSFSYGPASTSASTLDETPPALPVDNGSPSVMPGGGGNGTPMPPTRRPSIGSGSRPVPVPAPLLSPIPWLVNKKEYSDDESVDSMDLSKGKGASMSPTADRRLSLPSSPTPPSNSHHPIPHGDHSTPTGGLVDELDPGTGGAETIEPVALTHSATVGIAPGSPLRDQEGETTSLRERFVRASSPRKDSEMGEGEGVAVIGDVGMD